MNPLSEARAAAEGASRKERSAVVCSLDLEAAAPLVGALGSAFAHVHSFRLRHGELRNGTAVPPSADVAVIAHCVDGRTLLLDGDGYYNRLLETLAHRVRGDVFIVLTDCGAAPAGALCDAHVVDELAVHQPSVRELAKAGRFLTCAAAPSDIQATHLSRSHRLDKLIVPKGVRERNLAPTPATKRPGRIGLCPIL